MTATEKVKREESHRYQEIREAYDILSDPQKRPVYDEQLERDQERLRDYEKIFKSVYSSYNSQFRSSVSIV